MQAAAMVSDRHMDQVERLQSVEAPIIDFAYAPADDQGCNVDLMAAVILRWASSPLAGSLVHIVELAGAVEAMVVAGTGDSAVLGVLAAEHNIEGSQVEERGSAGRNQEEVV